MDSEIGNHCLDAVARGTPVEIKGSISKKQFSSL